MNSKLVNSSIGGYLSGISAWKACQCLTFQIKFCVILAASIFLGGVAPVLAQTAWINPASGSWSTATNWSGGVPTGSVSTSITATGAPYVVSQSGGTIGVASLLMDSPDATLSLSNTQLNNNLNIPISLTRGSVTLNGGRITGSTIVGSAFTVLNTAGSSTLTLDRNNGLIRATGGSLGLSAGSFADSWDIAAGARIEADGATARIGISGNGTAVGWTNAGEIIARNGGHVTVGSTTTAKLGSLQIFDTARINLGTINNTGAILSPPIGGAFDVTGSVVTGGTIPAGAVLLRTRIGAGVVGLDLKGAIWEGDVSILNNALQLYPGSTFTGANLTAAGSFGISYVQTTTVNGKTFTLTSDPSPASPTTFTVGTDRGEANTVTLAADTVLRGTGFKLEGANNGTLVNQGLIESLAGNSTTGGLGTLQNDGRIRVNAGTVGVQPGALINNGIVEARAGTTISLSGSLTFTQSATGEMRGAGRFALNNPIPGGILRPGDDGIGTMTVQSPFGQPATFTGPTTFAIEIGGATSDQLFFNNGSKGVELGTGVVSLALTLLAAPTVETYRIVNLPAGFQNLLTGTFAGLAQGSIITAAFNGVDYTFTLQYDSKGVTLRLPPPVNSIALLAVVSRKMHASAGPFDLPINTGVVISGAVTVESRAIGSGHSIVFQFDAPVTAIGAVMATDIATNEIGAASALMSGNEVIVTLLSIADNQRVRVALSGVNGMLNTEAAMGFLTGDTNASRSVNSSDISAVKARSGQATTATNFRFDVNASGAINASDISSVKARSGLALP